MPACRLLRPSLDDSPLCLASQAHIQVSLYRLLSVAGLEPECGKRAEYVRRCDELVTCMADRILYGKDSLADRFLLTDALYFLTTETGTCYDASRMNRCHDLLIGLMEGNESFLMAPDACRIEPALARCLEAYFYPRLDADDAWTGLLHTIFARLACFPFTGQRVDRCSRRPGLATHRNLEPLFIPVSRRYVRCCRTAGLCRLCPARAGGRHFDNGTLYLLSGNVAGTSAGRWRCAGCACGGCSPATSFPVSCGFCRSLLLSGGLCGTALSYHSARLPERSDALYRLRCLF